MSNYYIFSSSLAKNVLLAGGTESLFEQSEFDEGACPPVPVHFIQQPPAVASKEFIIPFIVSFWDDRQKEKQKFFIE